MTDTQAQRENDAEIKKNKTRKETEKKKKIMKETKKRTKIRMRRGE